MALLKLLTGMHQHACMHHEHSHLFIICTQRMAHACCPWLRRHASMHQGIVAPVHVICHSLLGQVYKLVHPSPRISCTWKRLNVVPIRGLEKRKRPVEPACEHSQCSINQTFTHMGPHARNRLQCKSAVNIRGPMHSQICVRAIHICSHR